MRPQERYHKKWYVINIKTNLSHIDNSNVNYRYVVVPDNDNTAMYVKTKK